MKKTIILLYFLVTGSIFQVHAVPFKGLSAGANAAYTNYNQFLEGDIYPFKKTDWMCL